VSVLSRNVDATFYAQVEPEWGWASGGKDKPLRGAKVVRITQKKPDKPASGTVLVKLTLRLPNSAFLPLRPEAVVVVPEGMAVTTPLEVIAEDPS
jgi:hypothetical protein